jgi:hypothetical protein
MASRYFSYRPPSAIRGLKGVIRVGKWCEDADFLTGVAIAIEEVSDLFVEI